MPEGDSGLTIDSKSIKFCRDCVFIRPAQMSWREKKLVAIFLCLPILGWFLAFSVLREHFESRLRLSRCYASIQGKSALLVDPRHTEEDMEKSSVFRQDYTGSCGTEAKFYQRKADSSLGS